jgi:hypothetical protein
MKFFTIAELTRSNTATQRGIDNTPTEGQIANLRILVVNLLDPIREIWGRPLNVISGFRSEELNRAVGGSATSDHRNGCAADISAGSPVLNRELFAMIEFNKAIEFDQMYPINNYASIHVSFRASGNRNQIISR